MQLKWFVLQHLPVLLQESMGTQSDSQLVNSVYLDNATLELYKGRLDKTPGAIAVRFRWYGSGIPELVFVERKTHREAWTQEVSVKVRIFMYACVCVCLCLLSWVGRCVCCDACVCVCVYVGVYICLPA